jgi:hypothetical protein
LRRAQSVLAGWPDPPMGWFFRTYAGEGRVYRRLSRLYWDVAAPIVASRALARRAAAPVPA